MSEANRKVAEHLNKTADTQIKIVQRPLRSSDAFGRRSDGGLENYGFKKESAYRR